MIILKFSFFSVIKYRDGLGLFRRYRSGFFLCVFFECVRGYDIRVYGCLVLV